MTSRQLTILNRQRIEWMCKERKLVRKAPKAVKLKDIFNVKTVQLADA